MDTLQVSLAIGALNAVSLCFLAYYNYKIVLTQQKTLMSLAKFRVCNDPYQFSQIPELFDEVKHEIPTPIEDPAMGPVIPELNEEAHNTLRQSL